MAGEWRRVTQPGETLLIRSLEPGEYDAMCAKQAAKNKTGEGITKEDRDALREYLRKHEEIEGQAPEPITDDEWDTIMSYVNEHGDVPEEYKGRAIAHTINTDEGPELAVYEYAAVEHSARLSKLETEYHDVLVKVLPTMVIRMERETENGTEQATREVIPSVDPDKEELAAYSVNKLIELALSGDSKVRPRDRAIEKGALMSIGGRLAAFTLEDLKGTLTGDSIMRLPIGTNTSEVFDGTGKLNTLAVRESDLEALTEYHAAFLMSVLSMVESATVRDDEERSKIEFYVPSILDEIGIDPRPYSKKREKGANMEQMRIESMLELISPFELYAGKMPDNSGFYRVLAFSGYDAESQTMTIDTPYLFKLKRYAESIREGKKPTFHRYLHGSVANEPNQAAVELASRIAYGIAKRGTTVYVQRPVKKRTRTKTNPDGTKDTVVTEYENTEPVETTKEQAIPYTVKYSTLIADCPILRGELEAIEADPDIKHKTQAYNAKLKRAFEQAFSIIENKSDIPQKYIDLTLPTVKKVITVKKGGEKVKERRRCYVVPTKSTLGKTLVITYTGKVKEK